MCCRVVELVWCHQNGSQCMFIQKPIKRLVSDATQRLSPMQRCFAIDGNSSSSLSLGITIDCGRECLGS